MKKLMMAMVLGMLGAGSALADVVVPPAKVEVSGLEYAPRTDESGLADIDFKVTSNVGGTNLVFEVAAYSKDRATR